MTRKIIPDKKPSAELMNIYDAFENDYLMMNDIAKRSRETSGPKWNLQCSPLIALDADKSMAPKCEIDINDLVAFIGDLNGSNDYKKGKKIDISEDVPKCEIIGITCLVNCFLLSKAYLNPSFKSADEEIISQIYLTARSKFESSIKRSLRKLNRGLISTYLGYDNTMEPQTEDITSDFTTIFRNISRKKFLREEGDNKFFFKTRTTVHDDTMMVFKRSIKKAYYKISPNTVELQNATNEKYETSKSSSAVRKFLTNGIYGMKKYGFPQGTMSALHSCLQAASTTLFSLVEPHEIMGINETIRRFFLLSDNIREYHSSDDQASIIIHNSYPRLLELNDCINACRVFLGDCLNTKKSFITRLLEITSMFADTNVKTKEFNLLAGFTACTSTNYKESYSSAISQAIASLKSNIDIHKVQMAYNSCQEVNSKFLTPKSVKIRKEYINYSEVSKSSDSSDYSSSYGNAWCISLRDNIMEIRRFSKTTSNGEENSVSIGLKNCLREIGSTDKIVLLISTLFICKAFYNDTKVEEAISKCLLILETQFQVAFMESQRLIQVDRLRYLDILTEEFDYYQRNPGAYYEDDATEIDKRFRESGKRGKENQEMVDIRFRSSKWNDDIRSVRDIELKGTNKYLTKEQQDKQKRAKDYERRIAKEKESDKLDYLGSSRYGPVEAKNWTGEDTKIEEESKEERKGEPDDTSKWAWGEEYDKFQDQISKREIEEKEREYLGSKRITSWADEESSSEEEALSSINKE